jgi:hypothetical protein
LSNYVNSELTAESPADAVIFLGPCLLRYHARVPRRMLQARVSPRPHFYYFQYATPHHELGGDIGDINVLPPFPDPDTGHETVLPIPAPTMARRWAPDDTLSLVTEQLGGTFYQLFSPKDLARSIPNMLAQLRPSGAANLKIVH